MLEFQYPVPKHLSNSTILRFRGTPKTYQRHDSRPCLQNGRCAFTFGFESQSFQLIVEIHPVNKIPRVAISGFNVVQRFVCFDLFRNTIHECTLKGAISVKLDNCQYHHLQRHFRHNGLWRCQSLCEIRCGSRSVLDEWPRQPRLKSVTVRTPRGQAVQSVCVV